MISFKLGARQLEKILTDNSPTILAGIAVVGTAATAYLTGRASFKASWTLQLETVRRYREIPTFQEDDVIPMKDCAKLVWKEYIPAAGTGALTIAAIVSANRISARRAAALAAAYSLYEHSFSEYKEKIVDKLGVNKERAARDEIAQDKVNKTPVDKNTIVITGNGDVLCMDMPVGRYFRSNMEHLRRVQNDINEMVLANGSATLNELYISLKLSPTPYSTEIGWTREELLEFQFSATLSDDNQPCICIDYQAHPIRGYNHLG